MAYLALFFLDSPYASLVSLVVPQVRYANDSFADLCHELTRELVERAKPQWGIPVLMKAIDKIQLFPSQLTSIHADLAQVCLLAKNLKPALKYLDVDTTDIAKEGNKQGFDAKNFLTYYYYGGMIYAGLKVRRLSISVFDGRIVHCCFTFLQSIHRQNMRKATTTSPVS